MTPAAISPERPDSPDARALIDELEGVLAPLYPRASRHGLSVDQLLAENVAFFVMRLDGAAVGCGGIKLFGQEYGEVKRMYVRPAFRGLGLAKQMLDHLAAHAHARRIPLLRLETGIHQHAAIALYEHWGFQPIPPFGAYNADPLSRFYEKRVNARGEATSLNA
jgi:GNAT superfamily N-acetyltransferase